MRISDWSSDVCSSDLAAVEYEPDEEAILADLLPRNITIQIFKGILENAASEQGASMTAMDNATRNAGDLINKLTIIYTRTRQAAITTELIEIIAGPQHLSLPPKHSRRPAPHNQPTEPTKP